MDVAAPIAVVVPSLDGPVLTALAATNAPASLAALHRRAGRGSKSGVRSVLLRMVDEGLVLEEPGGFLLNREHLAAPAVHELTTLYETFLERLRHLIDESGVEVALVGLFGSAARRDGDSTSDIDILVVSDAPDLEDFIDLLADRISRWTGNRAQILSRTRDQLHAMREASDPIVTSWAADLVVVRGDRRLVDRGR